MHNSEPRSQAIAQSSEGGLVTIRDLLANPRLGLSVRAGEAGLDRRVEWAYVSELEDPTPWIDGDVLILTTGMAIPQSPGRQRSYIRRLAERGLAGVAIARGMFAPPLSGQMRGEADARGIPVLEVAYEIPYLAIVREVVAANRKRSEQRLLANLKIFDILRLETKEGPDVSRLFGRLEELSGYDLYLSSLSGRPLLEGVPPVPEDLRRALVDSLERTMPIAGGYSVPIVLQGRTVGHLVAVERPGRTPLGLVAIEHMATIAALELVTLRRREEAIRREGTETLAEMLSGMLGVEAVKKRLSLAGFDLERTLLLAAVSGEANDDDELHRRFVELGVPHLLFHQRDLYVLIPERPDALGALSRVPGAVVGVSRPFTAAPSLEVQQREAHWALRHARQRLLPIVEFSELHRQTSWLPPDPKALQAMVAEALGPVMEHDERHGGELLRSLHVLLERNGNVVETARALQVHRNTIAYRMTQIERLTGRDLHRLQDLTELWLAISAQEVVTFSPGTAPRA